VSQLEQAKQGASATRSAAAGVAAKENTCGITQVVAKALTTAAASNESLRHRCLVVLMFFTTVPQLQDLTAHLSHFASIWVCTVAECTSYGCRSKALKFLLETFSEHVQADADHFSDPSQSTVPIHTT